MLWMIVLGGAWKGNISKDWTRDLEGGLVGCGGGVGR